MRGTEAGGTESAKTSELEVGWGHSRDRNSQTGQGGESPRRDNTDSIVRVWVLF